MIAESVIHAEVARQTDPDKLHELELHLKRVIGEVRAAVEDWPAMRSQALDAASGLRSASTAGERGRGGGGRVHRVAEAHNFTFLGYRDYDEDGSEARPRHPARADGGRGHRPLDGPGPADADEGELALDGCVRRTSTTWA